MSSQFIRFLIVGIGATLLHLAVYWSINAAADIQEDQQGALTISYSVGYLVSLVANYLISLKWTFKTEGSASKGAGFLLSHAINYGMHIGLLNLAIWLSIGSSLVALCAAILPDTLLRLIPLLSQPSALAPLPVYIVVIPFNFILVRFFLTRHDAKI